MKKLTTPIDVLYEDCKKAVNNELRKDCRKEAMNILRLASEDDCREFLKYHNEDNGNICCLVLDRIKRDLIAEGKLEYDEEAAFGHPFM